MSKYVKDLVTRDIKRRLEGVEDVDVNVVWTPAWTPDMLSDEANDELGIF